MSADGIILSGKQTEGAHHEFEYSDSGGACAMAISLNFIQDTKPLAHSPALGLEISIFHTTQTENLHPAKPAALAPRTFILTNHSVKWGLQN